MRSPLYTWDLRSPCFMTSVGAVYVRYAERGIKVNRTSRLADVCTPRARAVLLVPYECRGFLSQIQHQSPTCEFSHSNYDSTRLDARAHVSFRRILLFWRLIKFSDQAVSCRFGDPIPTFIVDPSKRREPALLIIAALFPFPPCTPKRACPAATVLSPSSL